VLRLLILLTTFRRRCPGSSFYFIGLLPIICARTIHVAVVDPGVGSTRRPILAVAGRQFFIGPDNGILSYVLDNEPDQTIFHITSEQFFRKPLSATFHGPDVFAPVAAALSTGLSSDSFGPKIDDPVKLSALRPVLGRNSKVSEGLFTSIDLVTA
jgi:S-adenosylmethionine hydrolase